MKDSKFPLLVTLAYTLVGTGWIIAGYFLSNFFSRYEDIPGFEVYKGLAFVAVTAGMLFVILSRMGGTVEETAFSQLAGESSRSIRIGERTARWLPAGLVAIVVTLFGLLLLGLASARENALKAGEQSADALRHTVAAQTGSALRVAELTLGEMAHALGEGRLANPDQELRRRLLQLSSVVRAIWVVDAQGRMIHDSDQGSLGIDLSKRDYFQYHRDSKTPGFFIGNPLRSVITGTWFVSASQKITGPDGGFRGAIVAALDIERFGRYWQLPGLGSNGSIALFRDDGTLLMRSPYDEAAIGRSFRQTPVWQYLVSRHETGVYRAASAVDGIPRVFGYGRVPEYPALEVFVGISEQHLLASWRNFSAISVGVFLIVAGLLSILVLILVRQMRVRIVLQKKTAELARYPLQNRNPVISVSPAGARLFMNDAARQLILSTRGTAAAQQLDKAIQDMAAEQTHGSREFAVGSRTYSASFIPHPPECCDIYLMDITLMRQGEDLLRLFFDLPFIGMAISSPDSGRWLRCNEQLCEILGYSREQLTQKTWAELTHPEDLAADTAELQRVLRGESDGYAMDKRLVRSDGTTIHASTDIRAVRRPDRSIEYFVITVHDISERKLREHQLRRQRNLYAALSATHEAVVRLRERDAIFHRICRVAVEQAGFAFAWMGLLDGATSTIRPAARFGEDHGYIDRIRVSVDPLQPEGRGLAGLVVREGRHRIINDIAGSQVMQPWYEELAKTGTRSTATFPVRQGGSIIGTLHFYSLEKNYFTDEIVKLLDEMADALSYALDNLENERQRATALAELKIAEERWQFALEGGEHGVWEWNAQTGKVYLSLQWKAMLGYAETEIGDTLDEWQSRVHPDDLQPTLQALDRHLRGETAYYISEHRLRCKDGRYKWILDRGKVMTRDGDGKPLIAIGTHTDITKDRETRQNLGESEAKFKSLVEQSLVGIFIIDDTTMYYANPRTAEIFGYAPDDILGPNFKRLIHPDDWPLIEKNIHKRLAGDTSGLKSEFRGLRRDGTPVHIGAHGSLSRYAGKPVIIGVLQDITERLQAERQIADHVARLERSIMSTVEAISQMVELRDPYTSGHERRVGDLAAAIGAALGFDEHRVTGLRVAGTVHDVGKITVPAEILSKPGRLSAAEYEIVKAHADKGHDILKNIDFPWPVAQTVWQHHERLDGSGYPLGLKGDAISIEARIIAVADVIESMASHRPYRPAVGLEAALAEIEGKTGSLYDPEVVAACLRLFREQNYKIPA